MPKINNAVITTVVTSLVILTGVAAADAQSANRCAEREVVLDRLGGKYGETRRTIGMTPNNSVVEMHASEETGSWTITVTHPNGVTCMVAAGTAFETIDPTPIGEEM